MDLLKYISESWFIENYCALTVVNKFAWSQEQKHIPTRLHVRDSKKPDLPSQVWIGSTTPTKFQFSDHIRCSGHNRIRELILGGILNSLKRALRIVGLIILGVTVDTMLHWWCDKQRMSPNTPQVHHIRDRKVKMSDSYGQRKLFDEKPNCLVYVHNEIRAFFPMKKSLYLICQIIWSYKFKLMDGASLVAQ